MVSNTEEGTSGQECNQEHVGSFLFIFVGLCTEFVPQGQMAKCQCNVLKHPREKIHCKWPALWHNGFSNMMMRLLTSNNTDVTHHLPYLLDLTPWVFFLFPQIKLKLTGFCFDTVDEIQRKLQVVLQKGLPASILGITFALGAVYHCTRRPLQMEWRPDIAPCMGEASY